MPVSTKIRISKLGETLRTMSLPDQDVDWDDKAEKANVLELDNVTPFTPDADYEPSTKKYVDDKEVIVLQGEYLVTTGFLADEVITLSTGSGTTAGVATKTGDTIDLEANATDFFNNHRLAITLNGVRQTKGVDVIWDSSGSLHFVSALDNNNDYIEINKY